MKSQPLFFNTSTSAYGIFETIISNYLKANLSVCLAVEVISTDASFATVRPLISQKNASGEPIELSDHDNIPNVPIMFFSGAFGSFKFKVARGDKGLLIASNLDITNYKKTHTKASATSSRSFSFSDGFFIPLDFGEKEENLKIQNGGSVFELSPEQISATSPKIKINAEAEIIKEVKIVKNLIVEGNITVKGNIETDGSLIAKGEVEGNKIKLSVHKHTIAGTPPVCPLASGTPIP